MKNVMKELETGIPSVCFKIKNGEEIYNYDKKDEWKCFHCKIVNKDGKRKECINCGKPKKTK